MKLKELYFCPFLLTSIKPEGWLLQQLQIQADGVSGHLDEFWPDIKDSAWIGGKADGWERMPYWLDGVISLAWLLDDEPLKSRINLYVDYIIKHQHEDGWLGPRADEKVEASDLWSQALAMKMLVVYHDATGDLRIPCAVEKALRSLDGYIDNNPLSKWGQFRWFENLIAIWWLYEQTQESWLIDLAVRLHAQGFNWKDFFSQWPITDPTPKGRWNYSGHVVNNAMALKGDALWWRLTENEEDKDAANEMVKKLDKHHGMVTGVFTGDECLAGISPIQGTELCAVVEYMYSLENLISITGDVKYADRLEKITFNALPATFSPDMWSHQYDQQVNQIECSVKENRTWNTNGDDANIFGLEPHFGCCTANLSQGWPKFVAHLWMRAKNGIAAVAYAPSTLKTEISDVPVKITLDTDYPFREELTFKVEAESPIGFSLFLRIPEWADNASIEINGDSVPVNINKGFCEIRRKWSGTCDLLLTLPMECRVEKRPGNTNSILRGPLVYALNIAEEKKRINIDKPFRELPHGDWEIYPASPWNYALNISEEINNVVISEHAITDCPFSPEEAPVSITIKGKRVPEWIEENGSAPVPKNDLKKGEEEELVLIPFGCTNLRIAEFPIIP